MKSIKLKSDVLYQYVIYNNDIAETIQSVIPGSMDIVEETSVLFTDEAYCRKMAAARCEELDKDFETTGGFSYRVESLPILEGKED